MDENYLNGQENPRGRLCPVTKESLDGEHGNRVYKKGPKWDPNKYKKIATKEVRRKKRHKEMEVRLLEDQRKEFLENNNRLLGTLYGLQIIHPSLESLLKLKFDDQYYEHAIPIENGTLYTCKNYSMKKESVSGKTLFTVIKNISNEY